MRQGILFIISGPSGTGKTTLCRMVEERLQIPHMISYTTRPPRKNEIEGKDYFFVQDLVFDEMIQKDEFLEWAKVHDYRYGTSLIEVEKKQKEGKDLFFDLDTQGALTIQSKKPDAVLIFLDITDDTLAERLGKRATEDDDIIKKRLNQARIEREYKQKYDYQITNENLESAYQEIADIIQNEREKKQKTENRKQKTGEML